MERFCLYKHFKYSCPVNHTSMNPDGKLLVIVGDDPDGMLVDSITGKVITPLKGHLDFSFASAWHPDGRIFARGNQDKTCGVWDVRNLSKSVAVLKGNIGAIRSIRFSSDGQFMAPAEPADFVHVCDVKNDFEEEQEVDFFGEISGISFSPDTESLFIGVWDRTYGSLLQYSRSRRYSYLDSMLSSQSDVSSTVYVFRKKLLSAYVLCLLIWIQNKNSFYCYKLYSEILAQNERTSSIARFLSTSLLC